MLSPLSWWKSYVTFLNINQTFTDYFTFLTYSGIKYSLRIGWLVARWKRRLQPERMLLSTCHTEEVKGQLCDVKRKMWVLGVNKELRSSCLACGVLGVSERIQGGVHDSGPLLLWCRICPVMARKQRRVKEEIDGWHVDFNKLLFDVGQIFLQTHTEEWPCFRQTPWPCTDPNPITYTESLPYRSVVVLTDTLSKHSHPLCSAHIGLSIQPGTLHKTDQVILLTTLLNIAVSNPGISWY